ncbi:hypothetical protein GZH46_00541, partial [Fragariocoptes setiger]
MAEASNLRQTNEQALFVRRNNNRRGNRNRGRGRGNSQNANKREATDSTNAINRAMRDCPERSNESRWSNQRNNSRGRGRRGRRGQSYQNQQSSGRSNQQSETTTQQTSTYDESAVRALITVIDDCEIKQSIWVADSGCSVHMTPAKLWLYDYEEFERKIPIKVGNNEIIVALGSGKIRTTVGILHDVHYVPNVSDNLFSIGTTVDHGISFRGAAKPKRIMFEENGRTIFEAKFERGVFVMSMDICTPSKVAYSASLSEWHERFVHVSSETIKHMVKHNVVDGLEISNKTKEPASTDCAIGKIHRCSHPESDRQRATKPGLTLHFDTAGPFRIRSMVVLTTSYYVRTNIHLIAW